MVNLQSMCGRFSRKDGLVVRALGTLKFRLLRAVLSPSRLPNPRSASYGGPHQPAFKSHQDTAYPPSL